MFSMQNIGMSQQIRLQCVERLMDIGKLFCDRGKWELTEEWKESIIVPIYKKDDKTDCTGC
jgi:hypothetical protein